MLTPLHRFWTPCIVAVFLPCAHAAGSSGSGCSSSGAHGQWYDHEWQYNYVEALILICLILVAVAFEQVWERVEHGARHAYRYGHIGHRHDSVRTRGHAAHGERESSGRVRHDNLTKEFVHRCGGEFMTLGVLAFCVFMFNNAKGFEAMEKLYKHHAVPLPRSASDWLHMVELVHMKLFVGMVLYFILIGSTVRVCDKKFMKWESCRLHQVSDLANGKNTEEQELDQAADTTLAQYDLWQRYFIERIVLWKHDRENLYKALLDRLDITAEESDVDARVRGQLMEQFSFASYLVLNISEGMRDTINVHLMSWASLLILFGGFVLFHRFGEIDLFILSYVFIGITMLLLIIMGMLVKGDHRVIKKFVERHTPPRGSAALGVSHTGSNLERSGSEHFSRHKVAKITAKDQGRSINQRFKTEDWAIRVLQVVLFLVSYVFSRTLMDFHDWEERPQQSGMISICFVFLFAVLTKSLHGLPTFLALAALPPYCDDGNVAYLFAVIEDAEIEQAMRTGGAGRVSDYLAPSSSIESPSPRLRSVVPDIENRVSSNRYVTLAEMNAALADQQQSESEIRERLVDLKTEEKQDGRQDDTVRSMAKRIDELSDRLERVEAEQNRVEV